MKLRKEFLASCFCFYPVGEEGGRPEAARTVTVCRAKLTVVKQTLVGRDRSCPERRKLSEIQKFLTHV